METYLHNRPVVTEGHRDTFLVLECDTPDCLALSDKLTDQMSGLEIPHLDPAVTTTAYNAGIVELQARNTVIVCGQSMNGDEFG